MNVPKMINFILNILCNKKVDWPTLDRYLGKVFALKKVFARILKIFLSISIPLLFSIMVYRGREKK